MELYKREPSGEVRAEIASRVTDPDTLVRYACEEDSEPAITAAVRHLTDILSKAAWEANRRSKAEGKAAWDRQGRALCTIANRLIAQGLAADVAADAIRHISNLDILREINLKGATEAVQNAYDTKYRYLNGECHMMQLRRDRPSASFPAGYPYKDEFEYIDSQYD